MASPVLDKPVWLPIVCAIPNNKHPMIEPSGGALGVIVDTLVVHLYTEKREITAASHTLTQT